MELRRVVRSVVRPLLTMMGFGFWIGFIVEGVVYPEAFQWTVIGMVAWWFGERTYGKWVDWLRKNTK